MLRQSFQRIQIWRSSLVQIKMMDKYGYFRKRCWRVAAEGQYYNNGYGGMFKASVFTKVEPKCLDL